MLPHRQRDMRHPGRQKQQRRRRREEQARMRNGLADRTGGGIRRDRRLAVTARFIGAYSSRNSDRNERRAMDVDLGRVALQREGKQQHPSDNAGAAASRSARYQLGGLHEPVAAASPRAYRESARRHHMYRRQMASRSLAPFAMPPGEGLSHSHFRANSGPRFRTGAAKRFGIRWLATHAAALRQEPCRTI